MPIIYPPGVAPTPRGHCGFWWAHRATAPALMLLCPRVTAEENATLTLQHMWIDDRGEWDSQRQRTPTRTLQTGLCRAARPVVGVIRAQL